VRRCGRRNTGHANANAALLATARTI
jgi:hypothetical protein